MEPMNMEEIEYVVCGIGGALPIIGLYPPSLLLALPLWGRNLVMIFEMTQQFGPPILKELIVVHSSNNHTCALKKKKKKK